ncbi:MAG: LeuA family protein [Dehalococcoidia bacterium]
MERQPFRLLDTTLRDGVQAPGIRQPTLAEKLRIIDFDAALGISAIDLCLPGVGGPYFTEGVECARYVRERYPAIEVVVLARTIASDVEAAIEFASRSGVTLSVILFRGSSPLRLAAEGWTQNDILGDIDRCTRALVAHGQRVVCATEDTTRTMPGFLKRIVETGVNAGASEVCIADTVGYADPVTIRVQTRWLQRVLRGMGRLPIHYHGHNDTGLAVANSLAAIGAGAETIHVTWLGIGERAGNTALEPLLAALAAQGVHSNDPGCLMAGAQFVSQAFARPIAVDHPLVGQHVFTTSTGIHAAGIHKAEEQGDMDLAGLVYSAVAPAMVGRDHTINIGPLSGKHNVERVFKQLGMAPTEHQVTALLDAARDRNRDLTVEEVQQFMPWQ